MMILVAEPESIIFREYMYISFKSEMYGCRLLHVPFLNDGLQTSHISDLMQCAYFNMRANVRNVFCCAREHKYGHVADK